MRLLIPVFALILGLASRYDPGVMRATIEARQAGETDYALPSDIEHYDGYIATLECEDVGREAWVWFDGVDRWLHVLVTDCAVRDDSDGARSWMQDNNILFEIDGRTAARYGYSELGPRSGMLSWARPMIRP